MRVKDREGRVVPLHPGLAAELRAWRESRAAAGKLRRGPGDRVFRGVFPAQKDSLAKDLARAGIEKKMTVA